jgi:hypothetical protein
LRVANFYEKALFVKPTWRPPCGGCNYYSVPFALCFYSHSRGAHALFGGSVHHGIRLFGLLRGCCDLPSGLPGGWAKFAGAVTSLDPKRVRVRAVAIRRFGVVATLPVVFTSSVFLSAPSPLWLSCLLPPLAPMRVMQRIVDLRGYPQPMQEHRQLSRCGHRRPLLGVLASTRGDLLSMTS